MPRSPGFPRGEKQWRFTLCRMIMKHQQFFDHNHCWQMGSKEWNGRGVSTNLFVHHWSKGIIHQHVWKTTIVLHLATTLLSAIVIPNCHQSTVHVRVWMFHPDQKQPTTGAFRQVMRLDPSEVEYNWRPRDSLPAAPFGPNPSSLMLTGVPMRLTKIAAWDVVVINFPRAIHFESCAPHASWLPSGEEYGRWLQEAAAAAAGHQHCLVPRLDLCSSDDEQNAMISELKALSPTGVSTRSKALQTQASVLTQVCCLA
jgi:hypothetical protein